MSSRMHYHRTNGTVPRRPHVEPQPPVEQEDGSAVRGLFFGLLATIVVLAVLAGLVLAVRALSVGLAVRVRRRLVRDPLAEGQAIRPEEWPWVRRRP